MQRVVPSFALGAALLFTAPAAAFEVTGGEVQLAYSAFWENTDASKAVLEGAVEFGFNRNFGVQLDLGFHNLNLAEETGTNGVLHAIFHLSDRTSVGAFYGMDRLLGESIDFYGLELGQEGRNFDFEAYVGLGEEAGGSGTVVGLSGRYNVNEAFSFGLALHRVDIEDSDATRIGITSEYAMTPGFALAAEFGTVDATLFGTSDSEAYFEVGATWRFGAERGATFGKRGLLELLPGL